MLPTMHIFARNINQLPIMKKLLLSFVALCAGTQMTFAQACGDGIATSKTWTNGASDFKWETSGNWSPAGAPDCDDNVTFGNNSDCDIFTAVRVNNITCPQSYTKRISIKGTSSLRANDISLNGGSILGALTNDTFRARNITMGFGSIVSANHCIITGTLSMGNSQFNSYSNSTVDIRNLSLRNYSRFNAPDGYSRNPKAVVKIRGDLYRESLGTFIHNNGLVRFIGSTEGTINTNNSEFNLFIIEIDKKADGAGDITTPAYLRVNKTLGAGRGSRIIALQRLSIMEASLNEWSTNSQIDMIGSRDTVIVHSSMANNVSTNFVGVNGAPHIGFTGSGNGVYIVNTPLKGAHNITVDKSSSSNRVTVLNKQEIGWTGYVTRVTRGILTFDGSTNAKINGGNGGIVVTNGGKLIAPDDDTLFYNGSWNFANETSFDAQSGVVCLNNTASMSGFVHNNDTVYFNHVVVNMPNSANPSNGVGLNFASGTDCWAILGDFTIPATSRAYIGNAQMHIYGNFTAETPVNNSAGSLPGKMIFMGNNNQTVKFSANARNQFGENVEFNKTGGSVTLASNWDIKRVAFTKGIVKPSTFDLTITNANWMQFGNGSANSYVDGALSMNITQGTSWRLYTFFPVGKGSTYAPARLESISGANTFKVEYFGTGYSGTNTVNSPLDTVMTTEYWKIDRVSGSSNIRAQVSLSRIPSSWTSGKQRVAYNYSGSNGWVDGGKGSNDQASLLRSGTSVNSSQVFATCAMDKELTAPIMIAGEGVSGNEIATQRNKASQLDRNGNPLVQFDVYPNPVSGMLKLDVVNAEKGVVTVSDLTGKILGTYNAAEVKTIDFSNMANGLYLVNFTDGLVNITHRVSKN
jgi:hypothetical protein